MEEGSFQVLGQFSFVSMVLSSPNFREKEKVALDSLEGPGLQSAFQPVVMPVLQTFKPSVLMPKSSNRIPMRSVLFVCVFEASLGGHTTQHIFEDQQGHDSGGNYSGIFILKLPSIVISCHFKKFILHIIATASLWMWKALHFSTAVLRQLRRSSQQQGHKLRACGWWSQLNPFAKANAGNASEKGT